MIVFDNIIFSIQKSGGISVVWYELLHRILNDRHIANRFIEYDNAVQYNLFRKSLTISDSDIIKYKSNNIKIKRYLNPSFIYSGNFIFHSSYYRTCNNKNAINITTVHDFTYEYFSHGIKKFIHCWQKHKAIRKSDYIICVSNNTKNDLLKFVPDVDEKKIKVIYNGVSNDYYPICLDRISDFTPFKPYTYVLFVGERKGYKNFDLSIKAISHSNLRLVIVGKELLTNEIKLLESTLGKDRYKYVGRISNNQLNSLYNGAFCLLYPSSYEGFGIPVIEAQRAGCPVIAYNSSSIKEIIGDTPLLLEKLDIDSILFKLTLLEKYDIRKRIIDTGIKNSKRFSWENMHMNIINLYQEALNKPKEK